MTPDFDYLLAIGALVAGFAIFAGGMAAGMCVGYYISRFNDVEQENP